MSKQFWILLAVVAVALGGVFFATKPTSTTSSTNSTASVTNHIEGKGTSGVMLQEYGDYQCPVCGTFFSTLEQVRAKYGDQLAFQFSNLPLTQLQPDAFAAARAAEAAGLQGKYFEMHALLYQNQSAWSSSKDAAVIFNSMAQQLGLNMTQFKSDYDSTKVNNAINADISAFNKTKSDLATPTFFLDGKKVKNTDLFGTNGPSVEKFTKLIDAEIAAKSHK